MATKKRAAPKKNTAKTTVRQARQTSPVVDSPTVRLLIICFTLLSIVFALVAFWRYG
jgi:hypothetical protein